MGKILISQNDVGKCFEKGELIPAVVQDAENGDVLMLVKNQTKPYEVNHGESDALVDKWVDVISQRFDKGKAISSFNTISTLSKTPFSTLIVPSSSCFVATICME